MLSDDEFWFDSQFMSMSQEMNGYLAQDPDVPEGIQLDVSSKRFVLKAQICPSKPIETHNAISRELKHKTV